MTREELFAVWAPVESIWSPWVKPVLFAHAHRMASPSEINLLPDISSKVPITDRATAIVIDLPGADGVLVGMALARQGFRPIPLFNAAPGPRTELRPGASVAVVEVWKIIAVLEEAGKSLAELSIAPDAPPVFLLDADRRQSRGSLDPGRFDNRSVSFPTDFPSSNVLLHQGLTQVLLIQERGLQPQPDLAHTLRRWQEAGMLIEVKEWAGDAPPQCVVVKQPSLYRWVWQRLSALAGLRRNPLGGFGGMLSAGSGSAG